MSSKFDYDMIIVIVLYDVEYDRYTYICVGGDAGSAKVSFIKLR